MIKIKVKVSTNKHKSKKSAPKKEKAVEPVMTDNNHVANEAVCPHCKEFIGYGDRDFCPHCGKKIEDRLL